MVDCVLYFEGDRNHLYRLLRCVKNRFGSTNEIGVFLMTAAGLEEVNNPSQLFLSQGEGSQPGSVVCATMEGSRPLLVEIQALVASSGFGNPRRMADGLDYNRLALLLAVLESGACTCRAWMSVNVVGGVQINEPAADLAVVLAVASAFRTKPATRLLALVKWVLPAKSGLWRSWNSGCGKLPNWASAPPLCLTKAGMFPIT